MQKYGQHFLVNKGIIDKITDAAVDNMQPNTVEIGPGKGAITRALLERGLNDFTLIEIDPEMISYLNDNLPAYAQVKIINKDFLKVTDAELPQGDTLFVSNLPYIDAADILYKTLLNPHFKAAVYMFQREQAQRIMAKPESKSYGPLSIIVQAQAEILPVCRVSPGSFCPPPKVDSEVLLFKPRQQDLFINAEHRKNFIDLVKSAFAYRRKTILNAFCECYGKNKDDLILILNKSNIPVSARAEELNIRKYADLAKNFIF